MNERIKALWWKARIGYNEQNCDPEVLEKFAELIIQQCAQVSEDDITDGDACCTNTAYRIAKQIKKHFGVEE